MKPLIEIKCLFDLENDDNAKSCINESKEYYNKIFGAFADIKNKK